MSFDKIIVVRLVKKVFKITYLVIFFIAIYTYRSDIYSFCYDHFIPKENKISQLTVNKYYREYNFNYVANTNKFIPENRQDILNIYYTIINSGMNEFTFYCDDDYLTCQDDVSDIANDQNILSNINNFVHPYNSFKSLSTEINTSGEIKIIIDRVYSDKMIYLIDYEIDKILEKEITKELNDKEKIRKIHDYIINHTKYDQDRSDNKITKYSSDNAFGVLTENYGVCGGYTDAMMLFLERFNLKSIRISSENHIWNYVNLNNQWYHLDLTWDDPISSDNKDILDDTYFLITDKDLQNINSEEHNYNVDIYK